MRISDWSSDVCSSDLVNKGAVGNPVELFLIGIGIGGFFDFLPRAALLAGTLGLAVGTYQHINVRFNSPRWWRFLFNTTEHHSMHHSQDYEATRSNYASTWIVIDRIFGTCVDGEAELLGMEGGRSEEHTSELQSLMRISYAVFCLKKKNTTNQNTSTYTE